VIPRYRKDDARIHSVQQVVEKKPEAAERKGIKPESTQKEQPADLSSKQDLLLSEKTLSNKEQRKADWAIMKEMSRYLWPKV